MKKRFLLTSVMTIVLCLSLLAGATFALFSSEDKVNVAINAGKVEVVATVENLTLYSPTLIKEDGTVSDATNAATTTFKNGGTAELVDGELTLTNVAPGDKVEFDVVVANNSNITAQYQTLVSLLEDTGLFAGLEVSMAYGANAPLAYDGFAYKTVWTELAPGTNPETVHVVVELPTNAGNEYQETSASLAITVKALQGNADLSESAPVEGVIEIGTAAELVAFANTVNAGTKYNDVTVKLTDDIDLAGIEWTPLNLWDSENKTAFIIDGNNKTISNMALAGGSKLGFIGSNSRNVTIKNLTFDKANVVTTGSQSAVVIGYQYGDVVLDGVKVTNSTVMSTALKGIRLGALVGQSLINDGASLTIANCLVDKVTVSGYHNIGGLVGTLYNYDESDKWSITGTTVQNSKLYAASGNPKHLSAFAAEGANWPHTYEQANEYFVALGNTQTGNTFSETAIIIANAEMLFAFAADVNGGNAYAGKTVYLAADIDLENKPWTPIGQTGATQFLGTFDGQNHTISNLFIDSSAETSGTYSSGLFGWIERHGSDENYLMAVKNVKVDGANVTGNHNVAVIAGYLIGTVENCHVTNATVNCNHANDDACGDKAGVIVGIAAEAKALVKGCTATDSTVTAGRDAGQIVGTCIVGKVEDCEATNVTVTSNGQCTGKNVNNAVVGRTN